MYKEYYNMKNTEQITINGKEYVLDLDKAKELKVLTEYKPLRIPEEGDVYVMESCGIKVLVVQVFHGKDQYQIIGCNGHCYPYSDEPYKTLRSAKELGELLESKGYSFKKNLNLNYFL